MPMGGARCVWARRLHATGCLMDLTSSGCSNADVSWTRSEFAAAELLGAGSRRMAGSSRHMNHPTTKAVAKRLRRGRVLFVMGESRDCFVLSGCDAVARSYS